jgi:hypothetical protein
LCKSRLKDRSKNLPPGAPWTTDAEFEAITVYFQPPSEDEGFNVVRHERRPTTGSNERNTMNATTPAVQEFFDQYAHSRSALDIDLIASQYADSIMFAGPNGARVTEKPAILAAFPKGQEFLKVLGHKSTKVLSLDETRLDDHYVLVRAQFVWRFEKAAAPAIDVTVDSTFILYIRDGVPKIVFQQEHEDFWQALRTRGVLPAQG